ncbi:MAG: RDD family protein [Microbacteriaceae bacterium]
MTTRADEGSAAGPAEADWPGRRLGHPASGPRSIARLGRRLAALTLDWALCLVTSWAFFGYDAWATLAIFAVTQVLFLCSLSGSIGHLVFGMRVVPVGGGWIGFWRPVARTALLCIVIPAAIWDRDQRGMHDRLAGTVLVRV